VWLNLQVASNIVLAECGPTPTDPGHRPQHRIGQPTGHRLRHPPPDHRRRIAELLVQQGALPARALDGRKDVRLVAGVQLEAWSRC
jgi:hypothetical protein